MRTHFEKAVHGGHTIFVSAVVVFELWYGIAKSARPEANTLKLETFMAGPVTVLPFEQQDARYAGELRATLETHGKPIGAYDLLIAGQALHHRMSLVTANVAEFGRVRGVAWQDWAQP